MAHTPAQSESSTPATRTAFLRVALLMAGTVSVGTLASTFSEEKLSFLYKDQLHLTASAVAGLTIFLGIPDYLRSLIGAGSDLFPLFGYHRRSYYALAALLGALGLFCLSLLPHPTYLTTALLVVVTVAGAITLMIMADAVMVTVGNQTGTVGRIQAIQQFLPPVLLLAFAAHLSGYVTQHWSYSRCFRMAALTALLALPLTLLIDETRSHPRAHETPEERAARREAKRTERAQVMTSLRQAAASPGLWAVVGYVFYLIFTPGTGTAEFYYCVDALHFSKQFLGDLGRYDSAGAILGILTFAAVSRKLSALALVGIAWGFDCSLYGLDFALHDPLSAKIIAFGSAFLGSIYTLCLLTLAARACPPHVEGAVYGLVMSAYGLAGALGEKVGSSLYDFYGPAHGHSIAHGWIALNGWGLALTIPAALLILLLPAWARSGEPLSAKSGTG